jgi:hypothetical protein
MDKLLDLYTDYLIGSTGQVSATMLSRMTDGQVSHDKITRFLFESYLDSKDLWRHAKPLIRKTESDDGVLIVDDCIAEKEHTDENAMICWHWDHSKQRYVKGVNFLSVLYHAQDLSVPIGVTLIEKTEAVTNPKTGKTKFVSKQTKNDHARAMLKIAHKQVKYRYVLADQWFASADNFNFIATELGKSFVMALECSRTVALSADERANGKFQRIDAVTQLQNNTYLVVYLRSTDFPVLVCKQVFTNKDGSEGVLYLVSNDTTLSVTDITALYHKRWKVEAYHKSLKQNTSLCKSPTKTIGTQANHFYASMLAFIKLEKLKRKTHLGHFRLKAQLYLVGLKAINAQLQLHLA